MRAEALQLQSAAAEELVGELLHARRFLRAAAASLPHTRWTERPSPAWSPVGWHVGHAAATLARWLLPPGEQQPPAHARLFDPFVTPKDAREQLPPPAELLAELDRVHERVAEALRRGPPPLAARSRELGLPDDFLVAHLAQHALQHAEHVAVIAALLQDRLWRAGQGAAPGSPPLSARPVVIEGGEAMLGSDDPREAYDNERILHLVRLQPYWIDASPVTVRDFGQFVAGGGYGDERLWTPDGWAWRCCQGVEAPLGWVPIGGRERWAHPDGAEAAALPVTGVSWFEADAFARWRGARLPTEAEWEHAAGPSRFPAGDAAPTPRTANVDGARLGLTPAGAFPPSARGLRDLAGNVWEWTASSFEPYAGFRAYPYDGYSTPWFGGTHRVLRGGSWATAGRLCRASFRNFYEPGFREIPAGLRCARDAA